jgi:hypothetical protein
MKKKIKFISIAIVLNICLFTAINIALAQGLLPPESGKSAAVTTSGCPADYTGNCGYYGVNDFIVLAIKVASLIMGLSGSLALLFFIYGGFIMFIFSGGKGKTTTAKQIITNATIGLIIIFTSYTIVGFVLKDVLKVKGLTNYTGWAKIGWYKGTQ